MRTGFIAQEVEKILPDLVYDTGILQNGETIKGVNYNAIIALLTHSVNTLTETVKTLTEKVNTLTHSVNKLTPSVNTLTEDYLLKNCDK